jgi:hypothetical protein
MQAARAAWLVGAALTFCACTPVVRYADALVDERGGRTLLTRVPAAFGGTIGFVVGVPIDVAAIVPAWLYYRSLPRESRDPVSVFLFPSFVLWKVGVLVGAPFDLVEWGLWRAWREPPPLTAQEREAIEREWDSRGNFGVYPVTPIHPAPLPAGGR